MDGNIRRIESGSPLPSSPVRRVTPRKKHEEEGRAFEEELARETETDAPDASGASARKNDHRPADEHPVSGPDDDEAGSHLNLLG